MKVIRNINNNVVLCIDSNGTEVVAFGKGIGFEKVPHELDVSRIERTFYDVKDDVISMINNISPDVFEVSVKVVEYCRRNLNYSINSNLIFTLADHLNFAIARFDKGMNFKLPIANDIEYMFKKEMQAGLYGLKLLRDKRIYLPKDEISFIAMHIVNARLVENKDDIVQDDIVIRKITKIIEKEFNIQIDKKNFSYSRFVSHMYYLIRRGKSQHLIHTENNKIYENVKKDYPETYACTEKVSYFLKWNSDIKLTDEEKLYLMLHINRLCTREDCYQ